MAEEEALGLLGLSGTPGVDEIEHAHRALAMEHHSDHGAPSDEPMARLNEAREVAAKAARSRLPAVVVPAPLAIPLRRSPDAAPATKPVRFTRARSNARVRGILGAVIAAVGILSGPAVSQFLPSLPELGRTVAATIVSCTGLVLVFWAVYIVVQAARQEDAWSEADSLLAARDICSDVVAWVWSQARSREKYRIGYFDPLASTGDGSAPDWRRLTRSQIEELVGSRRARFSALQRLKLAARSLGKPRHRRDSSIDRLWRCADTLGVAYFADLMIFHATESQLMVASEDLRDGNRIRFSPPFSNQPDTSDLEDAAAN